MEKKRGGGQDADEGRHDVINGRGVTKLKVVIV
jgi:hypothetical protein